MALTDNIVAYYKLDETSGTTAYDALENYNGTNNGATVNQAGKIGKAYDFDGVTDYVSSAAPISFGAFSISAWVKADNLNNFRTVYGGRYNSSGNPLVQLRFYNSKIGIEMRSNTNSGTGTGYLNTYGSTTLSTGTWYYVILTYDDSGAVKIYLDGDTSTPEVSTTYSGGTWSNINEWHIGDGPGLLGSDENFFDGTIDEVGVWNRALSSTEVAELYNSGTGLQYPFSINATIYPATLALSTTEQTTNIRLNFAGEALQSTLSLKTAIISAINPVYKFGQKELRTSWDALTALDPTKAVGHIQNLVPETSLVPSRYNVGI